MEILSNRNFKRTKPTKVVLEVIGRAVASCLRMCFSREGISSERRKKDEYKNLQAGIHLEMRQFTDQFLNQINEIGGTDFWI